jgi:hypothetical protein
LSIIKNTFFDWNSKAPKKQAEKLEVELVAAITEADSSHGS